MSLFREFGVIGVIGAIGKVLPLMRQDYVWGFCPGGVKNPVFLNG